MDVEYRCSSCGKKNSQTLPLKGVGHVGTVFGYNLGDPVREAKENALGKLRVLQSDQPNKYLITPISCVCERCGYREPWASLDHTRLEIAMGVGFGIAFISAILFLLTMKTPHPIRIVSLVFVILGLGLLVGPMIWKKIHSNKMVALAEKLPPECKPSFKLVGPSARTTSISRQPKVVQGTVAQDRLVRTPEDAHLVKLAKKQNRKMQKVLKKSPSKQSIKKRVYKQMTRKKRSFI